MSTKVETDNTITVPWKTKIDSHAESSSSSPKSAIERRIALVQQNLVTQPLPTKPSKTNKRKSFTTKISNISKSLLSQNQQIEINDSDQEKVEDNEENIDDDEEIVKYNKEKVEENENNKESNEEKDDTQTKPLRVSRRSKKKKIK